MTDRHLSGLESPRVTVADSRFLIGDMIAGKYRIESEIGRGGMGVVLSALHVELDQRVAVKVLHATAAESPEYAARFFREARAAAKIRSEHVARVIDVGTLENGTAYFVMEHLDGEDLADVLRREGALPLEQAVDYVLQACEGVAAAHAAGVVHRDLKPANLFVARNQDRSTTLKVLDFGVAKLTSKAQAEPNALDAATTETGHIFGSPTYMSPEQLRASGRVDTRADVWALGVVLYELLTNKTPFWRSAFAEMMAAVMRDPAPPLRDALADAPEELAQVIARCLEKDPAQRFPNVAALARALVPFAPEGVEPSVERMERLLGSSEVTMDVTPGSDPTAQPGASSSDSGKRTPSGRRVPDSGPRSGSGDKGPTLEAAAFTSRAPGLPVRRRVLVIVGLLLVGAVIGAAIVRNPPAPAPASSAALPSASAPVASSEPVASVAPPDAAASLPAEVAISIDGLPAGTKIYRGVLLVGTSPGAARLPRGADKAILRFVADGYAPAEIEVVPDQDRQLTVSLLHAPAPPVKPVKPVKPRGSKDLETF